MSVQRRKSRAALLSVVSNTLLVAGKLVVGLSIGSVSVISEAIHSAVDLVAAGIALFAVSTAHKPADEAHPFGHGKVENISGAVEALLIFVAALWIVLEAVQKLRHPAPIEAAGLGLAVMTISAVANWLVSALLFKVGRETDSVALQADGWHLRTDVYTSAGVAVGLGLTLGIRAWAGREVLWLDPTVAILVALLIAKTAWDLTREAGRDLLDAALPVDEEAWIRTHCAAVDPAILGVHSLRTRKSGPTRYVQFHLVLPGATPLAEAHELADRLEREIAAQFPGSHVTIHMEPADGVRERRN